eukprot:1149224-Pelagomonas_calceolata.AAC.9
MVENSGAHAGSRCSAVHQVPVREAERKGWLKGMARLRPRCRHARRARSSIPDIAQYIPASAIMCVQE